MKKERKGTTTALRGTRWRQSKGLVHSQSPSACATTHSKKPHPNATNAKQYREQIDESCLPYQQIA